MTIKARITGSLTRIYAVMSKEYIQLRRDRITYGIILVLPLVQLLLFGYAINNNPHHLPAAVLAQDNSNIARALVSSLERTDYLDIKYRPQSEQELDTLMRQSKILFAITIPPDFTSRVIKGERPQILVQADSSDSTSTAQALAALNQLPQEALKHELRGVLAKNQFTPNMQLGGGSIAGGGPGGRGNTAAPFEIVVHRLYNPENLTSYHVVPGLLGIILSITLVMMTAMSVTRERERGTMESLLATPATPLEIMLGKLMPYIFVGLIQTCVILVLARLLFDIPLGTPEGWLALGSGIILFITGNLALGYMISTIAANQLQAMQMSFFYLLPSIFLSGFAFPFYGMPAWGRAIGECLPVTHFLRIARGALLKDQIFADMTRSICMLAILVLVIGTLTIIRSRTTLD